MTTWMGRRPTMPDFRPVVGAAPGLADCWFAFGHQHLGLTLAARTGEIIGDLVSGRDSGIDLEPFRADRF
jgi:D-amino-acid dehydrogenase